MAFMAATAPTKKYCPRCGEFICYVPAFQVYEELVAEWLRGEMCPPFQPGFDVWKCKPFPELTFQVKHSEVYQFNGKTSTRHSSKTWNFNQSKWRKETSADYFVLFGTDENGMVQTFLMSRDRFVKHSSRNSTGGRVLNTTCNRMTHRGIPYIWGYHVAKPETELVQAVLKREELLQFQNEIARAPSGIADEVSHERD